jgi:uncharacterized membrane protein
MTPLSRRLVIALAVSGALNLLALGLFVGGRLRRAHLEERHERFARPGGPGMRGGPEGKGPRGDRDDKGPREGRRWRAGPIAEILSERPQQLAERQKAVGDARRAARDALTAEPYDKEKLTGALLTLRDETAKTQAVLHGALIDAAAKADKEGREGMARGFDRIGPGSF